MKSYNRYLYDLRMKRGISLKELSEQTNIRAGNLEAYEDGYRVPRYKDLEKLSLYYGEDLFIPVFYETNSLPDPVVHKEAAGVRAADFLFTRKYTAHTLYVILALSVILALIGAWMKIEVVGKQESAYGAAYTELRTEVLEDGDWHAGLIGGKNKKESARYEEDGSFSLMIFNGGSYYDSEFYVTKRSYYSWYTFNFGEGTSKNKVSISGFDYFGAYVTAEAKMNEAGELTITKMTWAGDPVTDEEDSELIDAAKNAINMYWPQAYAEMNEHISEVSGEQRTIHDVLKARSAGANREKILNALCYVLIYLSIVTGVGTLCTLLYRKLYSIKPGDVYYVSLKKRVREELTGDIYFAPRIREGFIVGLGVLLIMLGSVRYLSLFVPQIWEFSLFGLNADQLAKAAEQSFFAGMFLISIIDMDIFSSDRRMIRTMVFSFGAWLIIGLTGMITIRMFLSDAGSIVGIADQYLPGNFFLVYALLYAAALMLYYTPEWAKKRRRNTVIWRLLSLVPVLLIILTYLIGNAARPLFGITLSAEAVLFLPSKFFPFALTSIFCLYVTYFLRVYYARKYGMRRAKYFLDGNKFQMIKNFFICLVVLFVGLCEYLFRNNALMGLLGIGGNYYIVFLIPLLLFYHRHLGDRNGKLDVILRVMYYISIAAYFSMTALVLVVSFLTK